MRNQRDILIDQLDRKLEAYRTSATVVVPEKGWIHAIRTTLNMKLEQLGRKLDITRQGVKKIENSEAMGTISLNSLHKVGEALEMKLVYGFIPLDGSLEALVDRKSRLLAEKISRRTHQTMMLENQGIGKEELAKAIDDLSEEIKKELSKALWE